MLLEWIVCALTLNFIEEIAKVKRTSIKSRFRPVDRESNRVMSPEEEGKENLWMYKVRGSFIN